jgi:hypothetical protein
MLLAKRAASPSRGLKSSTLFGLIGTCVLERKRGCSWPRFTSLTPRWTTSWHRMTGEQWRSWDGQQGKTCGKVTFILILVNQLTRRTFVTIICPAMGQQKSSYLCHRWGRRTCPNSSSCAIAWMLCSVACNCSDVRNIVCDRINNPHTHTPQISPSPLHSLSLRTNW